VIGEREKARPVRVFLWVENVTPSILTLKKICVNFYTSRTGASFSVAALLSLMSVKQIFGGIFMGKLDADSTIEESDDFDGDQDAEMATEIKTATISKDMRRRLEDLMDATRLSKELREYDFRDI
jgi:hypothetical protein